MPTSSNHLIENLPRAPRGEFIGASTRVDLVLGDVLCWPEDEMRYAYFPEDSFISLVANTDQHPGLEVGMIGREGMLGVHLGLGVLQAPLQAVVQGAGAALRIEAAVFRRLLQGNPQLQRVMQRFTYVLMAQLATSAACVRFHQIEPRLARWLLMTQDRAHSDRFRVTQEFLAYMLGVRRVGVTSAAGALQRQGLINYRRGEMEVLDRSGLEAAACVCYAAGQAVYTRHLCR